MKIFSDLKKFISNARPKVTTFRGELTELTKIQLGEYVRCCVFDVYACARKARASYPYSVYNSCIRFRKLVQVLAKENLSRFSILCGVFGTDC